MDWYNYILYLNVNPAITNKQNKQNNILIYAIYQQLIKYDT